jgi:hypothetical protein
MGEPQFNFMFTLVPIIIVIVFVIVIGGILFTVFKGITQWSSNNKQPVLTVPCIIVSKRANVSQHNTNHNGHIHHNANTTYYTTFEVESGDRMELKIADQEYGQLAEGDQGKLTFQGTRYLGFERQLR